jgi:hypothetical protein
MTLRNKLTKLAYDNPGEIRNALLPLLAKSGSFLNDDEFEAKYGVRPGDKFKDQYGVWIVDYAETKITNPPMVNIYHERRGKGHAGTVSISTLNKHYTQV